MSHVSGYSHSDSQFKDVYFLGEFLLQYPEWPLGKIRAPSFANLVFSSGLSLIVARLLGWLLVLKKVFDVQGSENYVLMCTMSGGVEAQL